MPAEEGYELRGKYTKIDHPEGDDAPLRPSLEEAYRSASDSENEDVDEFDPLNYDAGTLKRKRPSRKGANEFLEPTRPRQSWARRNLVPSKFCCFLIGLFFVVLFALLGAGGFWVYKQAPKDGQSEPWYPTPKGGTVREWKESYRKASALVKQMTVVEKVNITTGTGWMMDMCVGSTGAVPRLGFPSLCLQDGPLGIRFADNITAFPAGVTVGATWNPDLMYERGQALGKEFRMKGINVMLGPSMGPLGRTPAGGRNWEGFGPDPVLQGIAAAQTIRGIQDEGVMATAKHFVGNEQEHFRQAWEWGTPNAISSNIDDRTLHELYAWPFADSIRAGAASVMCSYNQVNNSYACGNSKLLNGILKDEMGFQGFVQSDWLAQRSGVASALAGLDMSMPGDGLKWQDGKSLWGSELTKAVLNTSVPMDRLDDMVTRIVASWYQLGQDDKSKWPAPPPEGDGGPNFSSWTNEEVGKIHAGSDDETTAVVNKFIDVQGKGENAHGLLARKIAAEGTVVVLNEDEVLPLSRNGWKDPGNSKNKNHKFRVAIIGEDARENQNGVNDCPDKGCNVGTLASGWGSGAVEFPYLVSPIQALRKAFNDSTVQLTEALVEKIPSGNRGLIEDQDLCIVFINSDSGEGYIETDSIQGDRKNLRSQRGGDYLAKDAGDNCGKGQGSTIVVIHSVGPTLVENWINSTTIKGVIMAHLPGQESGNAIVDILFGDINPSGRLPYTVGKSEEDYGPSYEILTKAFNAKNLVAPQQNFTEGLYIDYRHFDKFNITPRYEFGFGLSYTKWHLSSLMIQQKAGRDLFAAPRPAPGAIAPSYSKDVPDAKTALLPKGWRKLKKYIYPYIDSVKDVKKGKYSYPKGYSTEPHAQSPMGGDQGGNPDLYTVVANVQATLTNQGDVDGHAVVQMYVSYPEGYKDDETGELIDFPVRVLRGFKKVWVAGGSKRAMVNLPLTRKDLSYWCTRRQIWVLPDKGYFNVELGFSSRDLQVKGQFPIV
ncbi:glycoside hydrolase family 3 protein [Aulographum hederae CBS 113979]|uniref:Probable beta-glucosidase E n=1 Tax=Aulographum hederae CBS 113979 TaxID=1176131 RepID=A0A6G1HEF7_9PEZI|nr:glycoside hydrolase family 3 protein [Aulographum hederae CBS 113979]